MLCGILHGIGDIDLGTDDMDTVGSVARGKCWIGERAGQRSDREAAAEHVDLAAIEVRRQKDVAVDHGEAFVDCAAGGVVEANCRRAAGAGPAGDEAVFGVKNELSAAEVGGVAVGDVSRWASGTAISVGIFCGAGDGHHQRGILGAVQVIQSRGAAVIVGDPEILPGKNRDSPGVQKLRVRGCGYAGGIGDQVGLEKAGLLGSQPRW